MLKVILKDKRRLAVTMAKQGITKDTQLYAKLKALDAPTMSSRTFCALKEFCPVKYDTVKSLCEILGVEVSYLFKEVY